MSRRWRLARTVLAPAVTAVVAVSYAAMPANSAPLPDVDDFSGGYIYKIFYNQKLTWSATTCGAEVLKGLECAQVKVPLDWHDPWKGQLEVAISRVADQPQRDRLLLTNRGGPGLPGLSYAAALSGSDLGKTHQVIGVDTRGVGQSTRLQCESPKLPAGDYRADGNSATFSKRSVLRAAQHIDAANKACAKEQASLYPYLNTEQTARDYNLIRHVLGYSTTDFYGVSYGTWLGSVAEKMFGSKFDRVALDANVDWADGSLEKVFDFWPESFQAAFDKQMMPFFARHNDIYQLGSNAKQVNANYRKVRSAAAHGKLPFTADQLDATIRGSLYYTSDYHRAGVVLKAALTDLKGGANFDLQAAVAQDTEIFDPLMTAVICNDTAWSQNAEEWYDKHSAAAKTLPLMGTTMLVSPCGTSWPTKPALTDEISSRPVGNVLMLQNEADPAASYVGARLARWHAKGDVRMIGVDNGAGHATFLVAGNDCVDNAVYGYLQRGKRASGDRNCAATPISTQSRALGSISDKVVYQFGNAATAERPLPALSRYFKRDLTMPEAVGAAQQKTKASATKVIKRSSTTIVSNHKTTRSTETTSSEPARARTVTSTGSLNKPN